MSDPLWPTDGKHFVLACEREYVRGLSDEATKEALHYANIVRHMFRYAKDGDNFCDRQERDVASMPQEFRAMLPGHAARLQDVRNAIGVNHEFLRHVLDRRAAFYNSEGVDYDALVQTTRPFSSEQSSKVRSTLKQCFRDWSAEGAAERAQCYGPVLAALAKLYPTPADRTGCRVLVPGCGLARLNWEIAKMGFSSEGNEFSYYMLLTSFYILNCCKQPDAHALYPFATEFKNLHSPDDQLRRVSIPDVDPTLLPAGAGFSMNAGEFVEVYRGDDVKGQFDAVTTCFFLDTANCVFEYVRIIARLLRRGGHWVNLGPLLYHYSDMPQEQSVELSWAELRAALPAFGLELVEERRGLPVSYAADPRSMHRTHYECIFFVARKTSQPSILDRISLDGRVGFVTPVNPNPKPPQTQTGSPATSSGDKGKPSDGTANKRPRNTKD